MKITITPTDELETIEGRGPCRVWLGMSELGLTCRVYVRALDVSADAAPELLAPFQAELLAMPEPSRTPVAPRDSGLDVMRLGNIGDELHRRAAKGRPLASSDEELQASDRLDLAGDMIDLIYDQPRPIAEALALVAEERRRQITKCGGKPGSWDVPDLQRLAVLLEEVGEVGKAISEHEALEDLEAELVQVAAVAVHWVEAIRSTRALLVRDGNVCGDPSCECHGS